MTTTLQVPNSSLEFRSRLSECMQSGFTLTELAIVLLIVGLLIGGMLMPLGAQDDLRRNAETRKTLDDIQEALLGFAAANGRLPCPATATTKGIEDPAGGGDCDVNVGTNSYGGFVPAATLGITRTNTDGYAVDAWGNPIRYAIYPKPINDPLGNPIDHPFTRLNGIRTATLPQLAPYGTSAKPLLIICSLGQHVTNPGLPGADCLSQSKITGSAVAVLYSAGKNAAVGGTSTAEQHNPNPNSAVAPDPVFVSHPVTVAGGAEGEFDDIVVWLSSNVLYSRLIAAGRLP